VRVRGSERASEGDTGRNGVCARARAKESERHRSAERGREGADLVCFCVRE
jgi:hypothetical protein